MMQVLREVLAALRDDKTIKRVSILDSDGKTFLIHPRFFFYCSPFVLLCRLPDAMQDREVDSYMIHDNGRDALIMMK